MANERTEQLIVDLAAALTPARRLPGAWARTAGWFALAASVAAAGIWAVGARSDLRTALATPAMQWSLVIPLAAAAIAAFAALRLSVPGADGSRWLRWLAIGLAASWAAILPLLSRAGAAGDLVHLVCVVRVIAIAAIPAVMLMRSIRQGYVLDAAWPAMLAALGSGAIGAAAVEVMCPIDRAAHVLVSHGAPILGLMALGAVLGGRAISAAASTARVPQ
jgi:hypothetical protein